MIINGMEIWVSSYSPELVAAFSEHWEREQCAQREHVW